MIIHEDRIRTVHFLLVEDDEDHGELIRRAFNASSVKSTLDHMTDGISALAYLHKKSPYQNTVRPDVILLDLKLPRLDGHEVLQGIRCDPSTATIPVVILTTSQARTDVARAYSNGANSYLVKPLDFNEFEKLILDMQNYWAVSNKFPA